MARTTTPTEADLVFNRSSIFAARSQRLLQALLGSQFPQDADNTKTTEQLEEEEAEVFKPESDVTGPGYDGEATLNTQQRRTLRADEKLRKQLLGKNARILDFGERSRNGIDTRAHGAGHVAPKSRSSNTSRTADSDEEQGRSSLGKMKRPRAQQPPSAEVDGADDGGEGEAGPKLSEQFSPAPAASKKKKSGSYLDEVLSARSKKKKKKKKKGKQTQQAADSMNG